ncbi:UPF0711 protein C18orf21 homolog isoform X3 [Neopelma chrysocephalum]|uniref:UPF0711 protein C18orf21 homolog isoform X3 n=1 Tax=Neopelma chrysocephalum TaxID=114329 RepID=UPI000FCD2A56|nr:UPF0711 protein C18orf21 homolog isoform X3 [Neopelma chrysocephalum]
MGRRRLLAAAAAQLAGACPGQARFLLWTLRSSRANERELERICPYCFQFLVPDGYRLVTCKSCNKTTRHYGKSRDFLSTKTQNSGIPSIKSSLKTPDVKIPSSKKITPVSCSRSGSKGNSPSTLPRTCESGQATTNSASKTPRNSKFHFSKLKRMLNLEEKERSQKADFKTFLTLL